MAGWLRSIVVGALLLFLLVWTESARAGVEPSPFSVPLLASAIEDPIFWVMFDPQPEPPGHELSSPRLDVSDPTAPVFKVKSSPQGRFTLKFAVQSRLLRITAFDHAPTEHGFQVSALGREGTLFTAGFSFQSRGNDLVPGSRIDFDPQPEPPGYPGVVVNFSLEEGTPGLLLAEDDEVEMTLRLSDQDARPLLLSRAAAPFVRGDANADGTPDMSDAVRILGFLFLGSTMSPCEDAADVNDDGMVDISDPVRLLGHLFLGSEPPPAPFRACGADVTEDKLGCKTFGACP